MPLRIPNLDDRNFTDLVAEAVSLLPRYAPEWTNHNPSDPGITLIELLAYFTEMLIYRLNRVTRENKIKFLQLLREVQSAEKSRLADPNTPLEEVNEALRRTVLELRQPQRAVTCEDYEYLTKKVTAGSSPGEQKVIRARCFARRNLETSDREACMSDCPGHVSVVIVPDREIGAEDFTQLLQKVRDTLEPMRLLTTRIHVVQPFYLWLSLGAVIRKQPDASFGDVQKKAVKKLQNFFNPLPGGGPDGTGWPFGRAVYLSEVYAVLEQVEGVDYVQEVRILRLSASGEAVDDERTAVGIQIGVRSTVGVDTRLGGEASADTDRLIRDAPGRLIAVALRPYELVKIAVKADDLMPIDASIHLTSNK